jgi:hypothetical protein
VEGREEELLLLALLEHLNIIEIEVNSFGGKNNFRRFLRTFVNTPGFDEVQSLGVVRDADDSPETAFQSVRDSLDSLTLPVPSEMLLPANGSPMVNVFIMPDNSNPGALEDLCLTALKEEPAMGCVSGFMECVQRSVPRAPTNVSKARMHAFLASREDPELRLGEAARRGYLPWDDAAFDQLIGFLRSL